ncbi:MAG: terminase large subunit domain-containing protein [Candidatus Acidiferrales bacterium]
MKARSANMTGLSKSKLQRLPDQGSEASGIKVSPSAPVKAIVQLLPYQRRWVEDDSILKIVVKGRQTGFSFSATLRAVLRCLERRTTWIFLSKGERQSRLLMEKVQEHIQSCGIVANCLESSFFEGTMTKQLEVRFPNGSIIYGLPANPDTARGYSGNVSLDEFAFHVDAEKIYTALYPIITRGYGLEVISTPNGQQGKFYELAKTAGLSDPVSAAATISRTVEHSGVLKSSAWSGHWCDIFKAVHEGLKVDIELLRAGVDEEAWRQEFCCEFVSEASEWIPAELFQSCTSADATTEILRFSQNDAGNGLYAGWDIARNRDLSVIWLSELVGDVTWTRGVVEMKNIPTPDQLRQARLLMPLIRRINIDQSGMGLVIAEQLGQEYPEKVEGIQFTQQTKEALAVYAKRRMEETKVRVPDDARVRASFRAIKKTQNAVGQFRFDTEHDAKYGHADHWWAFCLAETAAQRAASSLRQPGNHLAGVGGLVGKPAFPGFQQSVL